MQLVIDGAPLDLLAGQKIQLTKENALFAFDNLKCERTTEITLPDTPTNNALLRAAKHAATRGEGVRTRYAAEMRDGLVVKPGDLYVTAYTGGAYKAVFVTGQLLGLQRLKQAGNLPEIVEFTESIQYPAQVVTPANQNKHNWEVVLYGQERGALFPSADLYDITGTALAGLGVRVDWTGTEAELRYLPDVPHGLASQMVGVSSQVVDPSQPSASVPASVYNMPTSTKAGLFSTASILLDTLRLSQQLMYRINQLVAAVDIKVTFPHDFSSNLFLVSFDESGEEEFLGGYRFEIAGSYPSKFRRTYGEPLAGRSVEISRGKPFLICDMYDKRDEYVDTPTGRVYNTGWIFTYGAGLSWSFNLRIEGAEAENPTGKVWLQDNLPDVSVVDLLKAIAAVSGRALYYSEENGITFDAVDVDAWPLVELRNVVKVDDIRRTFADYARANIVEFDTAQNVSEWQRERLAYAVDNASLADEQILQVVCFSEGAEGATASGAHLLNANAHADADKYTLARCLASSYMQRCALPANAGVERLCNESTAATITARLSLLEFEQITPKTALLCGGVRYVWTGATWEDGVAVFDAQKF